MNFRLALFVILIAALSAFKPAAGPAMSFAETKHNFGFIHQGDTVSYDFKFTNTGNAPLIISNCEVACKCTTVDYPKTPIAPNATGVIKVTFDSKSAIDRQDREVIVTSNATNSPQTISFKCVVLKAKK